MNKEKRSGKVALLSVGLAAVLACTTGCSLNQSGGPVRYSVPAQYNHFNNYYKKVVRDGKATKLYDAKYTFVLFDKETFEPHEYIFKHDTESYREEYEMYDLETGEMIMYAKEAGIILFGEEYNYYYARDLIKSGYDIGLATVGDNIEGEEQKDYYSLEEIRELEPKLLEAVKILNGVPLDKAPQK